MPGLRRQPGISSYTNSLYHSDMHIPAQQYSWDRENLSYPRRPLTNRQRVPRPPQWLQQSKEDLKSNYLGTKSGTGGSVCQGSNESDDLQAMVHDFIENDSEYMDGVESDRASPGLKLVETLQMLTTPHSTLEQELLADVKGLLLTVNEDSDLICDTDGSDCKGGCIKRFVVKHLKIAGYNASVCNSKWLSSGRIPGGEYEYIDVVSNGSEVAERLIVDIDFQAQFEIARPTQQYEAALKTLPIAFVGSISKLEQILELMSEAAKVSLKQSNMHLPPWRTLGYMSSKWLSTFERKSDPGASSPSRMPGSLQWKENKMLLPIVAKQCGEQLRHTKVSLIGEMKGSGLVNVPRGRSSRANLLLRTRT